MPPTPSSLAERLRLLEASLPEGQLHAGKLAPVGRRGTRWKRAAIVTGIVAAMLVSGVAGAAAHEWATGVRGYPGVFVPGGPLACSPIQHMTPPVAAQKLEDLGYNLTWQIEYRGAGASPDSSIISMSPPEDGYIIEGVLQGTDLMLLVERGPGARPVRGC
jgi:hypothetical protein